MTTTRSQPAGAADELAERRKHGKRTWGFFGPGGYVWVDDATEEDLRYAEGRETDEGRLSLIRGELVRRSGSDGQAPAVISADVVLLRGPQGERYALQVSDTDPLSARQVLVEVHDQANGRQVLSAVCSIKDLAAHLARVQEQP